MAAQAGDPELNEAPGAASSRPSRRTMRLLLRAALVIAVLIFTGWLVYHLTRGRYLEGTNDAYLRADSVTVSPKVGGYVEQVFVADNQDVKAGQPLVRIDARDYRAETERFQAQIDIAAADAENVRAGIREQEAAVAEARAALASAEATARFARGEVERYIPLAASGAETREKLATLRTQAAQAQADLAAKQAAVISAERRIVSLKAQVRQAQAQGEAARAQFSAANADLGSTVIRASVAGRIGDKSVRAGQFVQPGTRMMSVVPVHAIYVIANFKETQIGLMRIGQPVSIEIDALDGIDLTGHVESLSPGTGAEFSLLPPQNATGNFTKIVQRVPVRIAIDEVSPRPLLAGLSTDVTVDVRDHGKH